MSEAPTPVRRRRVARQWHRWLGLLAALPLLWLSVTGLLLNHADKLGLHEAEVTNEQILARYNQVPEGKLYGMQLGDRLVSTWDGFIFLDHEELDLDGTLIGAVAFKNKLVIATDARLAVFNGSGEMELELDEISLPPPPIGAIGSDEKGVVMQTESGVYRLSEDFLSYQEGEIKDLSGPLQIIDGLDKKNLSVAIRGRNAMPLSRVILDAHSGVLFGWPGWLITDLTAGGAIILTLLGLRLFPKRKS